MHEWIFEGLEFITTNKERIQLPLIWTALYLRSISLPQSTWEGDEKEEEGESGVVGKLVRPWILVRRVQNSLNPPKKKQQQKQKMKDEYKN